MRAKELRELSDDELGQKERDLLEQLFHLKLRKAAGQLENPMRVRLTKRDLARVKTVRRLRMLSGKKG